MRAVTSHGVGMTLFTFTPLQSAKLRYYWYFTLGDPLCAGCPAICQRTYLITAHSWDSQRISPKAAPLRCLVSRGPHASRMLAAPSPPHFSDQLPHPPLRRPVGGRLRPLCGPRAALWPLRAVESVLAGMADETAADEVRLARSQPTTRPIPTCTPAERRLGALQRRAEQPRTPSCGGRTHAAGGYTARGAAALGRERGWKISIP